MDQLVEKLMGHRKCVNSIAFTPDGTGLVSGSFDNTVKFWDISLLRMDGPASGSQSQDIRIKADNSTGKHKVSRFCLSSTYLNQDLNSTYRFLLFKVASSGPY